jgi:hypothetical protein
MLARRHLLPLSALLFLAHCANSGSNVMTLAQIQAYADDLINALSAAGQAYLLSATTTASGKVLVTTVIQDLQQTKIAIDSAVNTTDARATALEIVAFAQQLELLVIPFLGAAAPFVPIALAVLQAFIEALPPPSNAPAMPPAQLHELALKYHSK